MLVDDVAYSPGDCTVIATSRSRTKRAALEKSEGYYVVATADEDLATRVCDVISRKGVVVAAYDRIARTLSETIIRCIRSLEHWVVYSITDATPAPFS